MRKREPVAASGKGVALFKPFWPDDPLEGTGFLEQVLVHLARRAADQAAAFSEELERSLSP